MSSCASPSETRPLIVGCISKVAIVRRSSRFLILASRPASEWFATSPQASTVCAYRVLGECPSTAPERTGLAEVVDDPLMVEPLSRSRLPEVLKRPAQRAGLDFAPGLVERMVEETTGGDALPLLAYTLRELYQRAGPDRMVSATEERVLELSRSS